MSTKLERRDFLGLAGAGLVGLSIGCERKPVTTTTDAAPAPVASRTSPNIRIASVPTAVEGGILPSLIAEFEKRSGRKVDLLVATKEVYALARSGDCDLVLSHYGHRQAEEFVTDGWGEWPRTVFSNQTAIFGPPDDPAQIRGLGDAMEAMARIAKARAPFVVNDLDGQRYVADILWNGAGAPPRDGWWIDPGAKAEEAITIAGEKRAYVLWGLTPFSHSTRGGSKPLEPLVYTDPLLQRLMVTIIVKREKVPSVDYEGAHALQSFLLEASTQAKMRATHYPGVAASAWAPAGRHNRYAILPIRHG